MKKIELPYKFRIERGIEMARRHGGNYFENAWMDRLTGTSR